MFRSNPHLWSNRLFARLSDTMPRAILDIVWGYLLPHLCSDPDDLWRATVGGIAIERLVKLIDAAFADRGYARPRRAVLEPIPSLVSRTGNTRLEGAYRCWTDKPVRLRQFLSRLSRSAYRELTEFALRFDMRPPLDLLVAEHADTFLDIYLLRVPPHQVPLAGLVKELLRQGASDTLAKLTEHARYCDRRVLAAVNRVLKQFPNVPHEFAAIVQWRLKHDQGKETTADAAPLSGSAAYGVTGWLGRYFDRTVLWSARRRAKKDRT